MPWSYLEWIAFYMTITNASQIGRSSIIYGILPKHFVYKVWMETCDILYDFYIDNGDIMQWGGCPTKDISHSRRFLAIYA